MASTREVITFLCLDFFFINSLLLSMGTAALAWPSKGTEAATTAAAVDLWPFPPTPHTSTSGMQMRSWRAKWNVPFVEHTHGLVMSHTKGKWINHKTPQKSSKSSLWIDHVSEAELEMSEKEEQLESLFYACMSERMHAYTYLYTHLHLYIYIHI